MDTTPDLQPDANPLRELLTADRLLDTLPWGVLVVDEQHTIQRINQQAARWGGMLPAALLGRPLAEAGLPPALSTALHQLPEPGAMHPHEVFLPQQEQWLALTATRQPGGWVLYGQDITPQKQREQQYQALADNTPDVLTRWTPDLRLCYANAAFARKASAPLAELLGCTNREMGQPEAIAGPYMAALQRVFDTGQPQEHFNQFSTPQGEVYYHSRLVPELRDGQIETVLSIAHDVTTLRQAEQAAQQSHDLLQSVFEAVPHSIMVLEAVRDAQHQVVDFRYQLTNGVADRHMGLDLRGRLLRNLLPGYLDEDNFRLLVETVETGQPAERTQHYDSLGGPLWLHSRYRKLGEWVVVSHEDVTASRQAQQEALRLRDELTQRATDKYHALLYTMNQGFCVLEVLFNDAGEQAVDYRYLELNPVFAEQSGMPADAQGKTIRELMPDVDPFWFDTFGQVVRTGAAVRLEHYLPQLSRWFDVHAFRMGAPEHKQVAVLFTDITARKQAEATLRRAAEAESFRLKLADALRPLADATEVEQKATQLLGEALGASRVFFASVEDNGTTGIIRSDYVTGIPSGVGRYPLAAFAPEFMPEWQAGRTTQTTDVNTDPRFTDAQRAAYRSVSSCAAVGVPLVKGGQLVALLGANHSTPRQWTSEEIALLQEAAERTWAAVERARAETALAASEAKYRTLFESTDEGVSMVEALFDERGNVTDYRILEVNPAHAVLCGMGPEVVGQRIREVVPAIGEAVIARVGQVVRTGEPLRFEEYVSSLGCWFDTYIARVGGAGSPTVVSIFSDITARKRREANLAFLAEVSEDLVQLTDIDATMNALGEKLAAYLGLSACAFAELFDDAEIGVISHGWHRAGMPSLLGTYRMREFMTAEVLQRCQAGEAVVVRDVFADALTDGAQYATLHIGSFVSMPLVRDGEWRFLLVVYRSDPHDWGSDEVELIHELTARIWTRLERARAEAATRAAEERYLALYHAIDQGACTLEVAFDEHQKPLDYRFLEVSPSFERQTGIANAAGRWMREIAPSHDEHWFEAYGRVALTGVPARFENYSTPLGRWWSVYAFRVQDPVLRQVSVLFSDITDRKRIEAALRESEEQLRLFVMASSDALYRMSADWQHMLQLEGKGFLADTKAPHATWLETYILPADQTAVDAAIQAAIAGPHFFELEHRVVRADNSVGWTFSRAVPVLNEHGELVEWFGTATDITARKQAEQQLAEFNTQLEQQVARRTGELRNSRDLLYAIAEAQSAYVNAFKAIRDESGHIVDLEFLFVNSITTRVDGGRPLVGRRYLEAFPEAENSGLLDAFRRVIETGVSEDQEVFYNDGQLTGWFRNNATRLGDGVLSIGEDITARKQAEQERIKNLRLLEQAEAVANLGSWDYSLLSKEFLWSDGMYQLFGLPLGQLVRPEIYLHYVVAEDRPQAERLVAGIRAGTGNFEETLRLQMGEQVKTVRVKVVVLYDEAGQPLRVLGVDLDISELQRLEADNLRLRLTQQQALFEAVQAAQEVERKRMAESLHNGIGQILYATKLRLDRLHASPLAADPALVAARREADQLLSEAIRQTRALSHELVPLVLEEFGLAAALQDIGRKMSTPQLRYYCLVQLDATAAPLAPPLQMALYRIAQELALNIGKHASGATEAGLELETMPGWVLLRAEDNGVGFAPPAPDGSPGLGLRSIRDRVTLLGGQLEAGSAPTGGAYVRIRIPLPTSSTP